MQQSYTNRVVEFLDKNDIQTHSSLDRVYEVRFNSLIFQETPSSPRNIGIFGIPYSLKPVIVSSYSSSNIRLKLSYHSLYATPDSFDSLLHEFVYRHSSIVHSPEFTQLTKSIDSANLQVNSLPYHLQCHARSQRLRELQQLAHQLQAVSSI